MDDLFAHIHTLRQARTPFALCTVVETRGSVPRKPGARMVVLADGQVGTIGGGAIEHDIITLARQLLAQGGAPQLVTRHLTHELGMCCGGGMTVFVDPQTYAPHLHLFGCGHVGKPLALMAAQCGWHVTAIDHRPDQLDLAAFPSPLPPTLTLTRADPLDTLDALPWSPRDTFVAVVTHDHALDEALVAAILPRDFAYLGCIGSRRKALKFQARLAARGLPDDRIARMRTPMGLDLGAQTPQEIAVSVLAEMISAHRGGPRWS